MSRIKIAAVQMSCTPSSNVNIKKAGGLVTRAAEEGANIILLPELFETQYFCQQRRYDFYALAEEADGSETIKYFSALAKKLCVVLPISFYEKSGCTWFNSVAVIDADGEVLGIYRKSHIPDDHFYQEKFYFTPGDTGFMVFKTRFADIGVGICWDQWFPEAARCMALMGADMLLYPTAIGSEPILGCDSMPHWQRVMQGHAAANIMPVIAANRVGFEEVKPDAENQNQSSVLEFFGSSFITDATGDIISQADRTSQSVIYAETDTDENRTLRESWGVFRDRRPELYGRITRH